MYINGDIVKDPKIIANFCSDFYSNLYTRLLTFFFFNNLTVEDSIICNAPLRLQEIIDAINDLKNNRSPGTDGLTAEFYKAFSKTLAPFLPEVFVESLDRALLPPTLCQGLITLIVKPNKDPLLIDSWRPITLLNNDYKIIALNMSKRLKCVLNNLIDECQSGFLQKGISLIIYVWS